MRHTAQHYQRSDGPALVGLSYVIPDKNGSESLPGPDRFKVRGTNTLYPHGFCIRFRAALRIAHSTGCRFSSRLLPLCLLDAHSTTRPSSGSAVPCHKRRQARGHCLYAGLAICPHFIA